MEREMVVLMLESLFDIHQAAKYMDLNKSQFMILVENQKIKPVRDQYFFKGDLDEYMNKAFSLKNPNVKEALFYYTMQSFCHDDEKETQHVLHTLEIEKQFDLRAPFYENLNLVCSYLHIPEVAFYKNYMEMEAYFMNLPMDTKILCKYDTNYPVMLKDEEGAPYFLFVLGNMDLLEKESVGLVGSEHPRDDEIQKALYLCNYYTRRDMMIVTGLERGINTYIVMELMKQQRNAILVLSSSFLEIYPKENRQLYEYIKEKGLVITQFIYHSYASSHIQRRNTTLAALSNFGILTGGKDQQELTLYAYEMLKQNKPVYLPSSMQKSYMKFPNELVSLGAKYFSSIAELNRFRK